MYTIIYSISVALSDPIPIKLFNFKSNFFKAFLTALTIAIAVHSVSCSSAKNVVTILFKDLLK